MGTRKRWTEGRKERDRGVQAEVCVCACVCVCVCGGWLLRFHMPTHSAPLRPLRPTFPDNEMRGSFRARKKKKKLCLLNLNARLISLFLKERPGRRQNTAKLS